MPRIHAIAAAVLLATLCCSCVQAGDFLPRATGSFAAAGADPAARPGCPDAASSTTSEADTATSVAAASPVPAVHAGPTRSAKHIGVDDVAGDANTVTATDEDKPVAGPAGPHRARGATRWQSLLPGVMK